MPTLSSVVLDAKVDETVAHTLPQYNSGTYSVVSTHDFQVSISQNKFQALIKKEFTENVQVQLKIGEKIS